MSDSPPHEPDAGWARRRLKRADPELRRLLEGGAADGEEVEAVVVLRPADPERSAALPEETERVTRLVLERVAQQVGRQAREVHVFRHLGTFIVAAEPAFLRALLEQPEIASAAANKPGAQAWGSVRPG